MLLSPIIKVCIYFFKNWQFTSNCCTQKNLIQKLRVLYSYNRWYKGSEKLTGTYCIEKKKIKKRILHVWLRVNCAVVFEIPAKIQVKVIQEKMYLNWKVICGHLTFFFVVICWSLKNNNCQLYWQALTQPKTKIYYNVIIVKAFTPADRYRYHYVVTFRH